MHKYRKVSKWVEWSEVKSAKYKVIHKDTHICIQLEKCLDTFIHICNNHHHATGHIYLIHFK